MLQALLTLIPCLALVNGAADLGFASDLDLTSFVTRPEIKAPRFNVTIYDDSQVTPGYWFIGPYINIVQQKFAADYYQPCTSGPTIYDNTGELVWSGACKFRNQNACDFRAFRANGTDYLSTILHFWEHDTTGHNVVMANSFDIVHNLDISPQFRTANMHEFNIINEGRNALFVVHQTQYTDVTSLKPYGCEVNAGWVVNMGFREVDLATGEVLFEWWSLDHVPIHTSSVAVENLAGPPPNAWNFFHINSIDKNSDGDYMISARFTDTIYKISGKDGSVLWRLGGDQSDFVLDGFNFSKQHDARFVDQNATTTIISFLDNASDGLNDTSTYSSALLVALETSQSPMVARVLRRILRPDQGLSKLRGNVQLLDNGHVFTGWSDNSYITEHTYDGKLLMEAQFSSKRMVTYRAYKFNFTSNPSHPPVLKAYVHGTSPGESVTACYVSWNGATEIATWEFYRNSTAPHASNAALIGRTTRTGFETVFHITGYEPSLYAQAVSKTGEILGRSEVELVIRPASWAIDNLEMSMDDFELPMKIRSDHFRSEL